MAINSRLRTTLATGLAVIVVAVAAALVIAAGGDDGDGAAGTGETETSVADPAASASASQPPASESAKSTNKAKDEEKADPGEVGPTVARQRFCPDLDPGVVSEALGVDGTVVLADHAPGDSYPLGAGQGEATSEQWICTIGEESGTGLAVTWSIWGEPAGEKLLDARLSSQTTQLGGDACEPISDDALGSETQGVDCSPAADAATPGFAAVSRMALAGDSLLECFLGSTDTDDMATLQAAAPELCGLFLSAVSG